MLAHGRGPLAPALRIGPFKGSGGHRALLSSLPVESIRAWATRQHPRGASELAYAAGLASRLLPPTSCHVWEHPGGQKSTPRPEQTVFLERSLSHGGRALVPTGLIGTASRQIDPTVMGAGSNSAQGLSIRGGKRCKIQLTPHV